MVSIMVMRPDCGLAHAKLLSRKLRELTKIHIHNMMVEKKLYLLSYQAGRDHVMRYLGGERRLSAWQRAKASEAARIAARHRQRPPQWWLDRHHARLRMEAERTRHFARPDDWCPNTYAGTPDYALLPIKRGPSPLRGCSLARRIARPPHGVNMLSTIYFTPDELRPTPMLAAPIKTPRGRRKPAKRPPPRQVADPQRQIIWEHISTKDAIAEIFGDAPAAHARGSP